MQIWYIIGEDHHHLHELLNKSYVDSEEAHDALMELQRELLSHLHGEERGVYSILQSVGGFETPVAQLRNTDRKKAR
jgi:DNA-binding ferritin-like protein